MLTGLKTIIVSLAVVIFGALESFDFTSILTPEISGYVTMAIGVIMFILRALTTTPILSK